MNAADLFDTADRILAEHITPAVYGKLTRHPPDLERYGRGFATGTVSLDDDDVEMPVPGSAPLPCDNCRDAVVVGPSQQAWLRQRPVPVLCRPCVGAVVFLTGDSVRVQGVGVSAVGMEA